MSELDQGSTPSGEDPAEGTKPLFGIDERPERLWECVLYGWQHTLVDISPFVLPLAVATALGLSQTDTARFLNFGLVSMGVATLVMTTIGNRLPIVQGPSATLIAALGPVASKVGMAGMWGAVFFGAIIEILLGATRLVGVLRRFLPAHVSGAVILVIGLDLGRLATRLSLGQGTGREILFAVCVLGSVLFLQTVCARVASGLLARAAIFISIWVVGLGLGGILGEVDWALVADKPWFAAPAILPFGGPFLGWSLVPGALLVVLVGYFGSMVESLGDYAATAAVAGERLERRHLDRGIFAEGIGCAVASLLGGLPCTSYTQNIGIIATTRVASRVVVQFAAGILILYGLCPKFGALLVAMPRPVLGGVFLLVCGMIAISGIRLLSGAVHDSSQNAMRSTVVGLTVVGALAIPLAVRGLGPSFAEGLPLAVGLLVENSVVLAVLLGVGLELLLVRGGEEMKEETT